MSAMSLPPIPSPTGNFIVDKSVVPYMREIPVVIRGYNLRPYSNVSYWFDDVNINQFVLPSSILQANSGFYVNTLSHMEGIYNTTSHAYAQVLETSANGLIYIDEAFTCMNVSPYGPGGSNTFAAGDYVVGDLVYMANNTSNVYANNLMGHVVYWNSTDGVLAVTVDNGTVANTVTNNVIFKVGSTKLANVINLVQGNKFGVGTSIKSVSNGTNIFLSNGWSHLSGVVSIANAPGNQIMTSGNVNANIVNSNIYICSGLGIGTIAKITSIASNNILTLNTSLVGTSGNTYYGLGNTRVDDIGIAAGIFIVPEDQNAKFQTGNRLITMNDGASYNDNTAGMRAMATFVASGGLQSGVQTTRTPVAPATPTLSVGASTIAQQGPTSKSITSDSTQTNNPAASADPLVQTFFTPKPKTQKTDYGIFASSVDLFFQNKPTGSSTHFPVSVYIVETVNGFPTTNILGKSLVRWEDVKTTDGIATFPDSSNNSTLTKFTFYDPVYLAPGTEYGIVVYSESPDYQAWVSTIGQTLVNTTRLVSESPYVGSLFKSQNASAWTPIQNQKLMFTLNKAVFSTTPVTMVWNAVPPAQNTYADMFIAHSSDLTFPVATVSYGVKSVIANTGVQDAAFTSLDVNVPLNYGGDLINSSVSINRRRIVQAGNSNSCLVQVTMQTQDPDVSPFFHAERFSILPVTNIINNGRLSNGDITILTGGNHINAANIIVTIGAPTGMSNTGYTALANVLPGGLSGNTLVAINITSPGSGYVTSPTITITEAGAPTNATAQIYGEDGKFGGNALVRYMTRPITLADGFDAGDIVVFMSAVRPQGTDIAVYYKVLSGSDSDQITNKNWKIMSKQNDVFSADQQSQVNLVYNTGVNAIGPIGSANYVEGGTTYPLGGKFKTFAIKIVMIANDTTVPPVIKNFRAVAVPAG
jgi:hypothetical protein